jgi:hypothetical protein
MPAQEWDDFSFLAAPVPVPAIAIPSTTRQKQIPLNSLSRSWLYVYFSFVQSLYSQH